MQVGLASAQHNIPVFGTTSFDLRFKTENGEYKTFEVSALVIENLSDPINLSINWLKKHDITLIFKKKSPVTLVFPDKQQCCSIAQIG